MNSTSFGNDNAGFQLGNNNGTIGTINISSDRPEDSVQRTENELLESLAFPQMLDRRENIEGRHMNTCEWILELDEYKSWMDQSCGLLWIKGKPGAGKSTLMVFLHDRLRKLYDDRPKELHDSSHRVIRLEFFFTARGVEMQRTPLGMLRSLLNQILLYDATIRPKVREIYEQRCRRFGYGERKWEWPQTILEEILATAILESSSRRQVIVFVDALDEAGTESAQQLAAYFHRLISRAEKMNVALRICISCRHYPIILESGQALEIYVEDHNHDDIAIYIKDILASTELGDGPSEEARGVLIEQLIQQAKGLFQWARLIMPLIRRRILEGESFDDIYCWLREVPAGLEDVYMYILNNVIEARNWEQSFLFFQWVCLAERPLTVTEMRYALAANNIQVTTILPQNTWEKMHGFVESDYRMKRRIKALSGGLAEIVSTGDDDESIQVVHQSVIDFLHAKGLGLLCHRAGAKVPVSVDGDRRVLSQCQATLYRSCLVYLATLHMPDDVPRRKSIRNHPFIAYATINLFIHAEKAASSRANVLRNEKDILQRVVQGEWIEIYRILDPNYYSTARPAKNTTIIHMAAAANLVDVLESIVFNSSSEEFMRQDGNGNTAFHLAARHGHIAAGKILLENGADCETKNVQNIKTPLAKAASFGQVEFVEWLLHMGAGLDTPREGCQSALYTASSNGHWSLVKFLLNAGADVNAQGGEYGNAL